MVPFSIQLKKKGVSLKTKPEQEVPPNPTLHGLDGVTIPEAEEHHDHDGHDQDQENDGGPTLDPRQSKLWKLKFQDRLAKVGTRHLYTREVDRRERPTAYNITLSTLQRMVILDLQRQLVDVVARVYKEETASKADMKSAKSLLAEYSTAIRDYDFMVEKFNSSKETATRDPFLITTHDSLGLYLFKDSGLLVESKGDPAIKAEDRKRYKRRMNILPGTSRDELSQLADYSLLWERLWMGLLGGLALIAPMLLMVLHKDPVTSLVTASVATMAFAVGLALLGRRLKGETVLASVAAYAAVLVVFVGASS